MTTAAGKANRWPWLPSLYFAEGLPLAAVQIMSLTMYKNLGISNADIALYTSWLYLPWVIKPVWSPIVEMLRTRRSWIIAMQLLLGAGFAAVALGLPGDAFFRYSLAGLWLLAFSSATHDIAADGFYILELDDHEQAWFVGIRNTAYRVAIITGQGLLVMVAGHLEESTGDIPLAWSIIFYFLAAFYLLLFTWHRFVLPRPKADVTGTVDSLKRVGTKFLETFVTFFKKPYIIRILAFLLLFRIAEAQLAKLIVPFLLDDPEVGGLGLSTKEQGLAYGTIGWTLLTVGGLISAFLAARDGLKRWIWWMVAAINVPNVVYIFLSFAQPESFLLISLAVGVEQLGYGIGFTAYTLYMIYVARGEHATAHFAICTGFMALGMMLPGMVSGAIQEYLGYQNFFVWVLLATIPSFLVVAFIRLDPAFGRKADSDL